MPTLRAIADHYQTRVSLLTSWEYGDPALLGLIRRQRYIETAEADPHWKVLQTAPMTPAVPPEPFMVEEEFDLVFHLGHTGWPELPLAYQVRANARQQDGKDFPLVLDDPWLRNYTDTPPPRQPQTVAVCWSNEWIELKMGLTFAVAAALPGVRFKILCPRGGGRVEEWLQVLPSNCCMVHCSWAEASRWLETSALYLGCLSGMWVMANATGTPVVAMEPAEQRWNSIFWRESPRNELVLGGDGKPSFHSPHVIDVLKRRLGL